MKFGVNTYIWGASFGPADFNLLPRLVAGGFDGIEVPILDPADGPLIAVRLSVLTRKSLGGLETDLSARVLGADGNPIPGLFAAGEVAGFGGGGMHGYRSLEGTFLGGCLLGGRIAGRVV